jgi:SAM-dependent methyltransferase
MKGEGSFRDQGRSIPTEREVPAGAKVLDACCGSRMFWFDRQDPRAVMGDIRREAHTLTDKSSAGGSRQLVIDPDVEMDFRAIPFADDTFHMVVFDPPHLVGNGKTGWLAKKYGKLGADWREDLRAGFAECFRVLRPNGTLIFKWNEHEIRVADVLALTPEKPLIGNRCGGRAKSHWLVFMKTAAQASDTAGGYGGEAEVTKPHTTRRVSIPGGAGSDGQAAQVPASTGRPE